MTVLFLRSCGLCEEKYDYQANNEMKTVVHKHINI